jgi:hypothetical protein
VRGRGERDPRPKSGLTEFAKWIGGMPSNVDPELVSIYNRALLIKQFPAYTFESIAVAPIRDLYIAMELMETARKVHSTDG